MPKLKRRIKLISKKNPKKIDKKKKLLKKPVKKNVKKQVSLKKRTKALKKIKKSPIEKRIKISRFSFKRRDKNENPEEFHLKKGKYIPKILRGMKDVFNEEIKIWNYVLKKTSDLAKSYGFEKIISPVLEERLLFEKSTGLTSDVVEKQMYQFVDQGGNKVVLRPELTPSVARAYIEQGMFNMSQPVKLYYFGPLFRYERPQTGRMRQFHQFGLEILGSEKPVVDAQLILFSQTLFNNLNLKVSIQINSLGCAVCRKPYRTKLVAYLKSKQKHLCLDCQRRLKINPLRILDCKNSECHKIISQAPQLVDDLCPDCRQHFVKVLEYLDEANVTYELNPYLIRGLDYYTKTVFEFLPIIEEKSKNKEINLEEKKEIKLEDNKKNEELEQENKLRSQSALGGGGRYDSLVETLGGRPTPAAGLAYGFERIVEEIKNQKSNIPKERGPQIFLAQIGDMSTRRALKIFEELREHGFKVVENLSKDSLKVQMEIANKLGVKLTLILGHQEVLDKTIIIRNMNTGNQEIVDQEKLIKELKRRL